jgi:hypothetical protein
LRFHLTPVRMAIIKNTNKKCWQECGRNNIMYPQYNRNYRNIKNQNTTEISFHIESRN